MPTSSVIYLSDLRCQSVHTASHTEILTDAPVDNQGKGEAFSPTDLVATALANCMLTIMGISAARHSLDMKGATATADKIMSSDAPRRIVKIAVQVSMPANNFSDKDKTLLENAARACPVSKSLHPDLEQDIQFIWL
jgi:uncharacterized OsmC-like protein